VNLLPKTAGGRITLAIVLSLLVHAVLVFGPNLIELTPAEPPLPPLQARLEPLPRAVIKQPEKKTPPKNTSHNKPAASTAPAPIALPNADASAAPPAAPDSPQAITETPAPAAPPITKPVEPGPPAHPLPLHAQLVFTVYKGTDFPVGQARHKLDIDNEHHYTLKSSITTVGLVSLFKTFVMEQQSSGTISAQGLRPDKFSEGRVNDDANQNLTAQFDWTDKTLAFSSGNQTALPEQTQDMLSFQYQLSQLPLDQPVVSMYISNGKKLEKYQLEVGEAGYILTRKGKMAALPLRKIHAPGEEGLEVWLGMEYRLLPVKIIQIDRKGEIAGQMVISDIRVSEEQD